MSSLVGKAAEEDEAFWSQSFFEEDEDNESFRSSDESIENQIDTFDSDFDESEGEEEANAQEVERGKVMEAEIAKEQRRAAESKSKKGFTEGGVSIARQLLQKKMGRERRKRDALLKEEGVPAGVISERRRRTMSSSTNNSTTTTHSIRKSARVQSWKASSQVMHGQTSPKTIALGSAETTTGTTVPSVKKTKRRFTQEELLIEALEMTEPENKKWLLGRKRDMAQTQEEKHAKDVSDVRVIQKFNSRRGCYNTLTFPEMDHVPAIFDSSKRQSNNNHKTDPKSFLCVITGKKARYRDPKTMLGYHDLEAFHELRRRWNSGELQIHSKSTKNKASIPVPTKVQSGDHVHTLKKKSGTKVAKDSKRLVTKKTTLSSNAEATPNEVPSTTSILASDTNHPMENPQKQMEVVDKSRSGRKRKKSEKMMAAYATDNGSTKVTKKVKVQNEKKSTNTIGSESKENAIQDSTAMKTVDQSSLYSTTTIQPLTEQHGKESHAMIPTPTVSDEAIHNSSTITDVPKDNGNMDIIGQNTFIHSNQSEHPSSSFPCFSTTASLDIASMFAMSLTSGQGDANLQSETPNLDQNTLNGDPSDNI